MSYNQLTRLEGLESLHDLETLVVEGNQIVSNIAVRPLSFNRKLTSLNLKGNPISSISNYKVIVMNLIPSLVELDEVVLVQRKKSYVTLKKGYMELFDEARDRSIMTMDSSPSKSDLKSSRLSSGLSVVDHSTQGFFDGSADPDEVYGDENIVLSTLPWRNPPNPMPRPWKGKQLFVAPAQTSRVNQSSGNESSVHDLNGSGVSNKSLLSATSRSPSRQPSVISSMLSRENVKNKEPARWMTPKLAKKAPNPKQDQAIDDIVDRVGLPEEVNKDSSYWQNRLSSSTASGPKKSTSPLRKSVLDGYGSKNGSIDIDHVWVDPIPGGQFVPPPLPLSSNASVASTVTSRGSLTSSQLTGAASVGTLRSKQSRASLVSKPVGQRNDESDVAVNVQTIRGPKKLFMVPSDRATSGEAHQLSPRDEGSSSRGRTSMLSKQSTPPQESRSRMLIKASSESPSVFSSRADVSTWPGPDDDDQDLQDPGSSDYIPFGAADFEDMEADEASAAPPPPPQVPPPPPLPVDLLRLQQHYQQKLQKRAERSTIPLNPKLAVSDTSSFSLNDIGGTPQPFSQHHQPQHALSPDMPDLGVSTISAASTASKGDVNPTPPPKLDSLQVSSALEQLMQRKQRTLELLEKAKKIGV